MAIEWMVEPENTGIVSKDDMYTIDFDGCEVIDGEAIAFYVLYARGKNVYRGSFDFCISKANDLDVENMSPLEKFELYLGVLGDENRGGKPMFNYRWVNTSGRAIVLSGSDMQAVLALAKKGAKHE